MNEINKEFDVAYCIFEKIVEYIELKNHGYCKCSKCQNIKSLLRLAKVNDKL